MKNDNQIRAIRIKEILEKYSDEENQLTTTQIAELLEKEYSITVYRTTVDKDIKALIDTGVDINKTRSSQNKYYVGERYFEVPEIKILLDAVASSKFITEKKSDTLISKLTDFTNIYQKDKLKRNISLESRAKPNNEYTFYIVDAINEAINAGKKISFKYFDFNAKKEKIYRNDGKRYIFSPYSLVWNGDYYYMVGYSDKHKDLGNFRVDRIESVPEIMQDNSVPMPERFDIAEYTKSSYQMFNAKIETVKLKCTGEMMKVMIDRFGDDVKTTYLDSDHFMAEVETALSPLFFGWIFGFEGKISIYSPESVKEKYKEMILDTFRSI